MCQDILSYYQSADALILPSLKEGLPNVVLEAMACGLPCVAARASGSRELIREGETGYTYTQGDVTEMGEALRLCLTTEGVRLGEKAREGHRRSIPSRPSPTATRPSMKSC